MNRYTFIDIYTGMTECFNVCITEEMLDKFKAITGDINPLHNNEEFAKDKGFEGRVCYGMLTASMLSTLAGVYLPGERSLIHSVDVSFVKPVYVGDILEVKGMVVDVNDTFRQIELKVEIFNQDAKKVLRGKMKVGVIDE